MPRSSLIMILVLLSSTAAAARSAQPPGAGTQPATAPAALPDSSTPKGTLKLLSEAMERGDAQVMRQLILADDPVEQKMVAAQIAQARAFAQLRGALVAAFGQQALEELMGNPPTATQRNAALDAAPETIEGDRATVTVEHDTYELRRVDGKWRLSLASMARSLEPAVLEESLQDMTLRSEVMAEVATEIAEGKYQNTDEVGQAVQGKLMVALMRHKSTTQPATTSPAGR